MVGVSVKGLKIEISSAASVVKVLRFGFRIQDLKLNVSGYRSITGQG